MKKIVLCITGCALLAANPAMVSAREGMYISAHGGTAFASDSDLTDSTVPGLVIDMEYDAGFAVDGAVGYDFGGLRLEGEVALQKHDLDKAKYRGVSVDLSGEASSLSFLVNGYVDFKNNTPLTPYLTAGLGVASIDVDNLNVVGSGVANTSDDDMVFAYQLGVGVGYGVSESVDLDLRYRYFATTDPEFGSTTSEFGSHNFLLGLKVSF